MHIDLIKAPLFYGCDREGVEHGPQTLMDHGLIDILQSAGNQVRDRGFIPVPVIEPENKYLAHSHMKYLDGIIDTNTHLANQVVSSLTEGRLPLVVGGDHSLGLGSLAGVTKALGNEVAVIWIDAHADINTPETSPSGNIHGMPLGASMGEGHESLTNFYYNGQKVNPRNCFIIGARSVDDGEVEIIDRLGINVWYMEEIREKGMGIIILELMELLRRRNIKDIHISYDIDSLDSALVPGTGTPVVNGMEYDESEKLIRAITSTGMVRSVDIVEYNPKRDHEDQITLKSVLHMVQVFSKALAEVGTEQKAI
ncbi:arginase [Proteiniclasticum sp. QWL-01]|uniref:arginase n=1 Tax=Proteiniclasticum sp. QWL-01 TaxID=3036945 RepID=UPI0021FED86A|nr:arginase [Proteiniclasticum sp. QWL-01]UUM12534.1 arginase [Clostridiaceae bacterium HFYG-1003]WFF74099.1 arginase [Proteiniclasticum sp. QWL-01]